MSTIVIHPSIQFFKSLCRDGSLCDSISYNFIFHDLVALSSVRENPSQLTSDSSVSLLEPIWVFF